MHAYAAVVLTLMAGGDLIGLGSDLDRIAREVDGTEQQEQDRGWGQAGLPFFASTANGYGVSQCPDCADFTSASITRMLATLSSSGNGAGPPSRICRAISSACNAY